MFERHHHDGKGIIYEATVKVKPVLSVAPWTGVLPGVRSRWERSISYEIFEHYDVHRRIAARDKQAFAVAGKVVVVNRL